MGKEEYLELDFEYVCRECDTKQQVKISWNTTCVICNTCQYQDQVSFQEVDTESLPREWGNVICFPFSLPDHIIKLKYLCPDCDSITSSIFDWSTRQVVCAKCQHVCEIHFSSGYSGIYNCAFVGEYRKHEACARILCNSDTMELCRLIYSASCAPLCQLPEYMIHYITDVRQAARVRFDELQE